MRSQSDPSRQKPRRRAKKRLPPRSTKPGLPKEDAEIRRLLHELQVHQFELEQQNDELIQARNRLESALERSTDLYDFAPSAYFTIDRGGTIRQANHAGARLLGTERSNLMAKRFDSLVSPQHRPAFTAFLQQVFAGREAQCCELDLVDAAGRRLFVRLNGRFSESGDDCRLAVMDLTERQRTARESETTVELLRLVNESRSTRELVQAAVAFFHQRAGCEAVGVRLCDGEDYPYFEASGFPAEFVRNESRLCARDRAGAIVRDSTGNPVLECMCGNIICGRFDPSKPFFTAHGSFWTNSTTALLASTTAADRQARTRNRCNGEGYESVALLPLRSGAERLGLLQLNDRRPGQFTKETIASWERLSGYLAVALAKLRAEEQVRQALAEKEVLLKEVHHRVKNNLQVVSGLLELQAERLSDPQVRLALKESQSRIRSIALVHEKLYQSSGLARLSFKSYLESLIAHLFHAHLGHRWVVRFDLRMPDTTLDLITAVPCGLLVNELVTNALKHAFPADQPADATRNDRPGGEPSPEKEIVLTWEDAGGQWRLTVADSGPGMPPGFDWKQPQTLGLRLVQMLALQLKGTVRLEPGPGCRWVVEFPKT